MGQKINPIGLRLGGLRKWKENWFLDSKEYTNFLLLNYEINKYLTGVLRNNNIKSFLINCYIGKLSLDKLYIFVFFYRLRKKRKKPRRNKYFNFITKMNSLTYRPKKSKKLYTILTILGKNTSTKVSIKKKKIHFKNITTLNLEKFKKQQKNKTIKRVKLKKPKVKIKKIKINYNSLDKYKLAKGSYKSIKVLKKSLSELTNSNVSLYLINVISFLKMYEHLHEVKNLYGLKKKVRNQRMRLEQNMISFFRYNVKYVRDVTNIALVTLFLKQPAFLAKFIGYQLYKTPRNYKHGKILYFLITVIKSIYSNRTEILGLRMLFKGRLNGRRRAKKRQFVNFGSLSLPTYTSHIEYGEATGLTQYGTIGIKIWVCYNPEFNYLIQKTLLLYFGYIKVKHIKPKYKFVNKTFKKKRFNNKKKFNNNRKFNNNKGFSNNKRFTKPRFTKTNFNNNKK